MLSNTHPIPSRCGQCITVLFSLSRHLKAQSLSVCHCAETALSRVTAFSLLQNFQINALGPILVSKVRNGVHVGTAWQYCLSLTCHNVQCNRQCNVAGVCAPAQQSHRGPWSFQASFSDPDSPHCFLQTQWFSSLFSKGKAAILFDV